MARVHRFFAVAALGLITTTGCVSQEKYNALKLERDQQAEQLAKSDADAKTARAEADSYKNQLAMISTGNNTQSALVTNLQQQLAQANAQLDDLNKKYTDAISRGVSSPAVLPKQLTDELQSFATANPDLVEFDSARGIVKFKSDLTFATGDATLTPKARDAIARFAGILNSPAAMGYELMVAGHTDSSPVANPETIRKGHKDNWYLSSHRAIAVGEDLITNHVNAQRVAMVGYADEHPIASNTSESGKAQNRRVEVLILPTTVRGTGSTSLTTAAPHRSAPSPKAEFNKDSVSEGASMNK